MSHSYRVINSQGRTEFDCGARPALDMTLKPGQRLSIRCRLQVNREYDFIEMKHGNAVATTEPVYDPQNVLFIDIVGDNVREVLELEHRMLEWAGLTQVPYNFQQQQPKRGRYQSKRFYRNSKKMHHNWCKKHRNCPSHR